MIFFARPLQARHSRLAPLNRARVGCGVMLSAFSFFAFATIAQAQSNIPSITVDESTTSLAAQPAPEGLSAAPITNEALATHLQLRRDIRVIEGLLARQSELDKLRDTYKQLDIPFKEPPPPRTLCQSLPVNGVCLKHYPDLYQDFVSQEKAAFEADIQKLVAEIRKKNSTMPQDVGLSPEDLAKQEQARKEAAERARLKREAAERKNRYRWTDIRCRQRDCRGVLVASADPARRYTVKPNDTLPDGTRITRISATGIEAKIGPDMVRIQGAPVTSSEPAADGTAPAVTQPAPVMARPIAAQAAPAALPVSTSTPASVVPVQAPLESAPPAGDAVSAAPTLGPSGLF